MTKEFCGFKYSDFDETMLPHIEKARGTIAKASVIYAYLMNRVEMYQSDSVPTAATIVAHDRNVILVNPKMVFTYCVDSTGGVDNNNLAFVLMHEMQHIFFDTVGRQKDNAYIPYWWNIATDHWINPAIMGHYTTENGKREQCQVYAKAFTMAKQDGKNVWLFDEKYIGMNADEIYDSLIKENKSLIDEANRLLDELSEQVGKRVRLDDSLTPMMDGQPMTGDDDSGQDATQGDSQGDSGEGDSQDATQGDSQGEGDSQGGGDDITPQNASQDDTSGNREQIKKTLKELLDITGRIIEINGKPDDTNHSESKSMDDENLDQRNRNKRELTNAAQQAAMGGKHAGTAEGNLIRMVRELFTPTVPWGEMFEQAIVQTVKNERTYRKYNPLNGRGIVHKGRSGECIDIVFGVDTSGSMTDDDLSRALSELSGILETYENWIVRLLACDTRAHEVGVYCSDDGDDIESIDFKLIGGGGTYMQPFIDYTEDLIIDDVDASALGACVILTDGGFDMTELDNHAEGREFDTIVIVTDTGAAQYKGRESDYTNIKLITIK